MGISLGNGVEILVRKVIDFRSSGLEEKQVQIALRRFRQYYDENSVALTRPYPGVLSMLGELFLAGKSLGVCTNKPEVSAAKICQILGIDPYLRSLVGGDSVGVRKPDPTPLLFAIDSLQGDPSETLYVGDSGIDYETAKAAGVSFAFFEGGYQRKPIRHFYPNHIVSSMREIRSIVIGE